MYWKGNSGKKIAERDIEVYKALSNRWRLSIATA